MKTFTLESSESKEKAEKHGKALGIVFIFIVEGYKTLLSLFVPKSLKYTLGALSCFDTFHYKCSPFLRACISYNLFPARGEKCYHLILQNPTLILLSSKRITVEFIYNSQSRLIVQKEIRIRWI